MLFGAYGYVRKKCFAKSLATSRTGSSTHEAGQGRTGHPKLWLRMRTAWTKPQNRGWVGLGSTTQSREAPACIYVSHRALSFDVCFLRLSSGIQVNVTPILHTEAIDCFCACRFSVADDPLAMSSGTVLDLPP